MVISQVDRWKCVQYVPLDGVGFRSADLRAARWVPLTWPQEDECYDSYLVENLFGLPDGRWIRERGQSDPWEAEVIWGYSEIEPWRAAFLLIDAGKDLPPELAAYRRAWDEWRRGNRLIMRDWHAGDWPLAAPPESFGPEASDLRSDATHSAIPAADVALDPGTLDRPEATRDLVKLDQAAALVHRTKRTVEKLKGRDGFPIPAVEGGGGKPHLYDWRELRPILEAEYGQRLPERFPFLDRRNA